MAVSTASRTSLLVDALAGLGYSKTLSAAAGESASLQVRSLMKVAGLGDDPLVARVAAG